MTSTGQVGEIKTVRYANLFFNLVTSLPSLTSLVYEKILNKKNDKKPWLNCKEQ